MGNWPCLPHTLLLWTRNDCISSSDRKTLRKMTPNFSDYHIKARGQDSWISCLSPFLRSGWISSWSRMSRNECKGYLPLPSNVAFSTSSYNVQWWSRDRKSVIRVAGKLRSGLALTHCGYGFFWMGVITWQQKRPCSCFLGRIFPHNHYATWPCLSLGSSLLSPLTMLGWHWWSPHHGGQTSSHLLVHNKAIVLHSCLKH